MKLCIAGLLAGAALAGCGGRGASATPAASAAVAYVRFVNGSPDIETVNPQAPAGANTCNFLTTDAVLGPLVSVMVNGSQAAASFPYGAVTPYVPVQSPAQIAVIYPSSLQNGCPNLTYAAGSFAPGSRHTIAVSGRFSDGTLRFVVFSDDGASASGAQFYNASSSVPAVDAGTFTPGQSNYARAATVNAGSSVALPVANAAQAPGIGFYALPPGGAIQTLLPSAVDRFDTSNAVPFNSESHISIFLIDGTPQGGSSTPSLVGAFQ